MTEVIVRKEEEEIETHSELERKLLYLLENSETLSTKNPGQYFIILERVFGQYIEHPNRQGDIRQYEQEYNQIREALVRG